MNKTVMEEEYPKLYAEMKEKVKVNDYTLDVILDIMFRFCRMCGTVYKTAHVCQCENDV